MRDKLRYVDRSIETGCGRTDERLGGGTAEAPAPRLHGRGVLRLVDEDSGRREHGQLPQPQNRVALLHTRHLRHELVTFPRR